ncbi:acyltransferase [Kitasatospora sp. CM 4170]|uniref:Acyltransferase family protein n=1 Tax=Kitasatospora aburaviensis TaxID=67265 RepID=A0ABW1EZS9_9ACTN|nr:acyltransferase [Kitasatospora sp. CM 4170]WNM46803.1 acyltransferase [Kitasatospora sp. CM 4170]
MKTIRQLSARRAGGSAKAQAGRPASRLGWLDALRGVAALVVALHHFDVLKMLPDRMAAFIWWHADLGLYGVMLFFLVSGYIIPASLERRGDMRQFWIGRFFRLWPPIVFGIVVALAIIPKGDGSVALFATDHDLVYLAANSTMLQDFMGVWNGLGVMWTLSYEMVFYYMVTALFAVGQHRRSGPLAVGFAAVALLFGTSIASHTLTHDVTSTRNLVWGSVLIVVFAFACILSGRQNLTRIGAITLGLLGFVLMYNNSRAPMYQTLMIFATMFAGTVLYRAENRQIDRLQAILCCGFVIAAGVAVAWMYNRDGMEQNTWTAGWRAWAGSYLAAWITFGIGMALRKRRFPKPLTWLGAISFSLYLLHVPLVHTLQHLLEVPKVPPTTGGKLIWTVEYLAVIMLASWVMYRLVELPVQKLGKKVSKAVDRRWPAVDPLVAAAAPSGATGASGASGAAPDRTEPPVPVEVGAGGAGGPGHRGH